MIVRDAQLFVHNNVLLPILIDLYIQFKIFTTLGRIVGSSPYLVKPKTIKSLWNYLWKLLYISTN